MDENYNIKSGEVFLTLNGGIIFQCTLCEKKMHGFPVYEDHISTEHLPIISVGLSQSDFDLKQDECSLIFLENASNENLMEQNNVENPDEKFVLYGQANNENSIIEPKTCSSQHVRKIKQTVNKKNSAREYKCDNCDFACKLYKNLIGHMKRHSNHKPHQCSACNKAFYTRFELKTHTRSHTGEKPYLCNLCGRRFITSGKLAEHVKRHTGQKDYQCKVCHRKFFNSQNLRRHLTVHSSERDYRCNVCNSSFKRLTALSNHQKLHLNKKEYACQLCPARFNQRPGLYSHLKSKHSVAHPSSYAFEEIIEIQY